MTAYLSLDAIKMHRDRVLQFTDRYYPLAVLLFIGLYVVQTACSLPGARTEVHEEKGKERDRYGCTRMLTTA